jgi:anthraniloyl-CoA monooxygenase
MLVKKKRPAWEVCVVERRARHATYGWGITLPRQTLTQLSHADPEAADAVTRCAVAWDRIQLFHRGRRVELSGMPLLGVSRLALLDVLLGRCEALGVRLMFDSPISLDPLPACDLLAIADGARSEMRRSFAPEFGTSVRHDVNPYAWLATPRVLASLTFSFVTTEHGVFAGHGYPFSADRSTFIVECSAETLQKAGLLRMSSHEAGAYLAAVFADTLSGEPLLFRHSLRWEYFAHVGNQRWRRPGMVLLGDAAHAIHFSVGSGTMLAIHDAIALAASLDRGPDIESAVDDYENERRSAATDFYELETASVSRLRAVAANMDMEPLDLAYLLLSR